MACGQMATGPKASLFAAGTKGLGLVGEGDALGGWSVPHSPSLAWTADDVWVGNLDLAPGCYEFKVLGSPVGL
ncbi:hypothetical protein HaLaN_08830 [Haematococcus lacustris]|uniref:CBM20 domain-containing protein n=1 Tax=Haematococcus lacustris TaxID=44745 RepID=A0A699YT93_HAELA|nr:hypothetical protein HaLaN_08830 [Haematococcus lacustris]